ncbi:hypothetical protein YC2023_054435 [Brassica napus]
MFLIGYQPPPGGTRQSLPAEKGYEIVFLLPKKALDQVKPLNLYPNLITFHTQSRACGE